MQVMMKALNASHDESEPVPGLAIILAALRFTLHLIFNGSRFHHGTGANIGMHSPLS